MTTRVGVLMAIYNGEAWLDEQIASVAAQTGLTTRLIVSDDQSSDASAAVVARWADRIELVQLPRVVGRFGNANHNFMRLIRDAEVADCDYIALSDQDDIWEPDKLATAVSALEKGGDAYSSNVLAFWDDTRTRVLPLASPQKRYDHLFQAPGPGCTFVISGPRFTELQKWVRGNYDELTKVCSHDWMIYLFARERGWRWLMDSYCGLRYRQHGNNEMGAHVGLRASSKRMKRLIDGSFRCDVMKLAAAAGHDSEVTRRLRRFSVSDRLWLASRAGQFRRRVVQSVVLACAFLSMKRAAC